MTNHPASTRAVTETALEERLAGFEPVGSGPQPTSGSTGVTGPNPTTMPYAATVTPSAATTSVLNVGTLTGALLLANPTGSPVDGQTLRVRLRQDSTGGRVVSFGAGYAFGSDVPASLLPRAAGSDYEVLFSWHADSGRWRCIGLTRGF